MNSLIIALWIYELIGYWIILAACMNENRHIRWWEFVTFAIPAFFWPVPLIAIWWDRRR